MIEPFDDAHLEAIVECVTAVWTSHNVIARALGVTADDYRPTAARICAKALADDLGLMLREPDTDRIVGFYTAIDLVDELAEEQAKAAGDNPRLARWSSMLSLGLSWYIDTYHRERPLARGEVVYFNIGGTAPERRGQGWIGRMTSVAASDFAVRRSYRRVLAIATHPHSVQMSRSLPWNVELHELPFADCGDPDLARITDPPCALVSVTSLADAAKTPRR
ncbi:hypothetical protein [Paraliomyxa miuraensis]|uniref:hypothetical protein n=1 Tax=Paraliomyxa miuraensis TaxID=376150 RepID=UPI00224FC9D6|nr:hypothetical protein [Paraliomyxa miuraensis]MCX4248075.1 hypothetical protein [Paraliomyxa miuraensis]